MRPPTHKRRTLRAAFVSSGTYTGPAASNAGVGRGGRWRWGWGWAGPGAAAEILAEAFGLGIERGARSHAFTEVADDDEVEREQVRQFVTPDHEAGSLGNQRCHGVGSQIDAQPFVSTGVRRPDPDVRISTLVT